MRNPNEWDENYLLNLPVGEFDWLEIKGRRGLDLTIPNVREKDVKQNLSKAISAFANSDGGFLVFGLGNPTTSWSIDDGGVDLSVKGTTNTREWLEDIIPHIVDPPLNKFNVYMVGRSADTSQIAQDRALFIVDIADSEHAPHQAYDNKYYARIGGKSRPIGHRFVSDIFSRRKFPKIQVNFLIKVTRERDRNPFPGQSFGMQKDSPQFRDKADLVCIAKNVGRVYARYMNCNIKVPTYILGEVNRELFKDSEIEEIEGSSYHIWSRSNTRRDVVDYGSGFDASPTYGPSWFDPILPGQTFSWEWEIRYDDGFDQKELSDLMIFWEAFVDNSPMESGSVKVGELEIIRVDNVV